MSTALQIALVLASLAATAGLLLLFYQLGRAALSIERFFTSAQGQLEGIAADLHRARLRLDEVADSLQPSLEGASDFGRALGRAGRMLQDIQERFQDGFESTSHHMGNLLGGLGPVLAFFRNQPQSRGDTRRREP